MLVWNCSAVVDDDSRLGEGGLLAEVVEVLMGRTESERDIGKAVFVGVVANERWRRAKTNTK